MSQLPHLLSPYLALPSETSLILLTSVLGASTNWLVLRYLQSLLRPDAGRLDISYGDGSGGHGETGQAGETKVLLVSFMRDLAFWKDGARKLGLDLDKLAARKKFAFVDGLGGLFLAPAKSRAGTDGAHTLRSDELGSVHDSLKGAVQALQADGGRVVLVIDQLDLLLATSGDKMSTVALGEMLMDLRLSVHATILTLAADTPLVTAQHTPLETNHAAFLLSAAHQANLVIGLRLLDTGTARDVSGVCRIAVGDAEDGEVGEQKLEATELLYFVGGDGGVKVFERGQ